jgi:hypothetical protein
METIITQVKQLVQTADAVGRKQALDSLRDLYQSLETEQDAIQRVMHSVSRLGRTMRSQLVNLILSNYHSRSFGLAVT